MTDYKLSFTKSADNDEAKIYKYITNTFGEIYAEKFRLHFIRFCNLLKSQPYIGRPAKKDFSLRVILFKKQNKIVYKVLEDKIIIIRILNTKTNYSSNY